MQIPHNVLFEISKHLAPETQSAFRRASKFTSSLPINIQTCCHLPSQKEIAEWLIEKTLVTYYETRYNFLDDKDNKMYVSLNGTSRYGPTIIAGPYHGTIHFPHQLYNLLQDKHTDLRPIFPNVDNYKMLADIMSRRSGCNEKCMLKLITTYAYIDSQSMHYVGIFGFLDLILNINGKWKFLNIINPYLSENEKLNEDDFKSLGSHILYIYGNMVNNYKNDKEKFIAFLNMWLEHKYSLLEPGDIL